MKQLTKAEFIANVTDYTTGAEETPFRGKRPAVVEFFATWCPHCQAMKPVLERVEAQYDGKVDFYQIDIDKQPEITDDFDIEGTPTIFYYPVKGRPIRKMGEMPAEQIAELIDIIL